MKTDYSNEITVKNIREQASHCPICGANFGQSYSAHRCKDSVYRGIDAANTRAENGTTPSFPRTFAQRLTEGYELLGVEKSADEE